MHTATHPHTTHALQIEIASMLWADTTFQPYCFNTGAAPAVMPHSLATTKSNTTQARTHTDPHPQPTHAVQLEIASMLWADTTFQPYCFNTGATPAVMRPSLASINSNVSYAHARTPTRAHVLACASHTRIE